MVVVEEEDKVHTDKPVVSKDFRVLEGLGEDSECITRVIWATEILLSLSSGTCLGVGKDSLHSGANRSMCKGKRRSL